MARIVGNPGESAAITGALTAVLLVVAVGVFLVAPSVWAILYYSQRWGAAGLLLALLGLVAGYRWRRRDFSELADALRESGNWLKGAQGEYLVHQELTDLSDEFIVFHDFHPRGPDGRRSRWNVDHIVVGPTGVFVLDAKYYSNPHVLSARTSRHTKRNVDQVQRNAVELKAKLAKWSNKALNEVFVVPIVVYVQDGARVDQLREGAVRVLPLRLLKGEILRHTESAMDLERAGRVALALYSQLPQEVQLLFKSAIDAYARLSRAERRAEPRSASPGDAVSTAVPTVCPLCGGALVRLTALRGDRTGKAFLGCANYKATGCKYGFNLE